MCTHQFRSTSKKKCQAVRLFSWISRNAKKVRGFKQSTNGDLPRDTEGKCIFHSENASFKEDLGFSEWFKNYKEASFRASAGGCKHASVFDCEDFVFSGWTPNVAHNPSDKIVDLSDISFPQPSTFQGARFEADLWFNTSTFTSSVQFEGVTFRGAAHFESATFDGRAVFLSCIFTSDAGFRETKFHGSTQFTGSIFSGVTAFNETEFRQYASFSKCCFETLHFVKVVFLRGINDGITQFENTQFRGEAKFHECHFMTELSFARSDFTKGEFLNVRFCPDRSSNFDNVQVQELLVFKSVGTQPKTFSHAVSFDLAESDIKGRLVFENVNLYFIQQISLIRKLASPSIGKVEIGAGCDKYKLRVEFRVPLDQKWRFLVEEMAESFVLFFGWSGKIPIQVNVECEYHASNVLVRYYADADITQDDFAGLLHEQIPAFIALLKDPVGFIMTATNDAPRLDDDQQILGWDLLRKVLSLNIGLGPRVQKKVISEQEMLCLLQVLGSANKFKNLYVNFYTHIEQKDFLTFGTKKIVAGGNLTMPE